MSAFGHQQGEVDAVFGEVGEGGVAELVQGPAFAGDLEGVLFEQVLGSFVGEPSSSCGWAEVDGCWGAGGGWASFGEENRPGPAVTDQSR